MYWFLDTIISNSNYVLTQEMIYAINRQITYAYT